MLEKQQISEDSLAHCLLVHYGLEIEKITYIPLGADLTASTYKAMAKDGSCYFIKVKKNYDYAVSIAVAKLLSAAGIHQVILPIPDLLGQTTHRLADSTLIVYPFIEGEDGFSRNLTQEQWILLGKVFKQIHSLDIPQSLQTQIRREAFSATWRSKAKALLGVMGDRGDHDEVSLKMGEFIREKKGLLERLVNLADELSVKSKKQSEKFVLCHADIHGGNVLIGSNHSFYIVDWDDPMMAPKERDLMFIGGGVANVWNQPREVELFYQGYGSTEVNQTLLAYYRLERIVEDFVLYTQELLSAPVSDADREKMFHQFTSQFYPNGVVEIALKSADDLC